VDGLGGPSGKKDTTLYRQQSIEQAQKNTSEALRWLLHDSDEARNLREHVSEWTSRLEAGESTEYVLARCYSSDALRCSIGRAPGWRDAASRAWNSLPDTDRAVLVARYLAHGLGEGPKADRLWTAAVSEVVAGDCRGAVAAAEHAFSALYQAWLTRRADA
jgi:hypothetical protein